MVNFENLIASGPSIVWQSYEGDPQAFSRRLILTKGGKIIGEHCEGLSALGEPRWTSLNNNMVNQIIVCEVSPLLISYIQDVEKSKLKPAKTMRKKAVKKKTVKKTARKTRAKKKTTKLSDLEAWNGEGSPPAFPKE